MSRRKTWALVSTSDPQDVNLTDAPNERQARKQFAVAYQKYFGGGEITEKDAFDSINAEYALSRASWSEVAAHPRKGTRGVRRYRRKKKGRGKTGWET